MFTNMKNLWQGDGASPIVLSMMFLLPGTNMYINVCLLCIRAQTHTYMYTRTKTLLFSERDTHTHTHTNPYIYVRTPA
jgi:hypothetical protein